MDKNIVEFLLSYESPRLYLDNYFSDLRNQADIETELKLIKFNDSRSTKNKINKARQNILENIKEFEKECIENFNARTELINELFKQISDSIQLEKYEQVEQMFIGFKNLLFSNKYLYFTYNGNKRDKAKEYFGSLIIIDNIFTEKIGKIIFW